LTHKRNYATVQLLTMARAFE